AYGHDASALNNQCDTAKVKEEERMYKSAKAFGVCLD
uniref:Uncharacterized protein n=1 Tax=Aegilops tauschii subsp. strangulata TaxID=200361 RepID=A0A452XT35_AEGTS